MVKRVRMGVAGLGRMGQFHADNLANRIGVVDLVRVVDAVEPVARTTAERLGTDWSTDPKSLWEDADLDGVVIATPTALHAEMVEQAAAAGKQIFCEKPISFDQDRTEAALEAVARAGVRLQIGFHRRFDPDWVEAREGISAGTLGEPYLFRTSLRDMQPPSMDYIRTSGGFFLDVSIHDLDTARWMVGEIEELTAIGAALSDPGFVEVGDIDHAVITLRFANGALGIIDNSRVAGYGYECSTEVVGSRATARIGQHRRRHVEWLTPGQQAVDHVSNFVERYPDAYRLELADFATAIAEDRPVRASGADGLAALVLSQAADLSYRQGRLVRLRHEQGADGVRYRVVED